MPSQHYDPITGRWQPFQRIDYTLPAYQQRNAPNALVQELQERIVSLERRGA